MRTFTKESVVALAVPLATCRRVVCEVRAARVVGPFAVETREGALACEDGWLAVDLDGWPYPIDADVFARLYEVPKDAPVLEPEPPAPVACYLCGQPAAQPCKRTVVREAGDNPSLAGRPVAVLACGYPVCKEPACVEAHRKAVGCQHRPKPPDEGKPAEEAKP